jgi:hypothetical protein
MAAPTAWCQTTLPLASRATICASGIVVGRFGRAMVALDDPAGPEPRLCRHL